MKTMDQLHEERELRKKLAMHMNDALRPRALVQIVDVLGYQKEVPTSNQPCFETGQRSIRFVRFSRKQVLAVYIVEGMNFARIARESSRRRELHGIKAGPEPIPCTARSF